MKTLLSFFGYRREGQLEFRNVPIMSKTTENNTSIHREFNDSLRGQEVKLKSNKLSYNTMNSKFKYLSILCDGKSFFGFFVPF